MKVLRNRVKRSVQQGPESGKRVYTAKIEVKFNYANNRVQECLQEVKQKLEEAKFVQIHGKTKELVLQSSYKNTS